MIATYSPVAPRLESQPDEEVEPMISLESVDVDNNEYDGESIDPLADSVHVAVVKTQVHQLLFSSTLICLPYQNSWIFSDLSCMSRNVCSVCIIFTSRSAS